ncbi:hypothetical protein N7457_000716 [Penicillium paradoxum]|uniref:uncharacterized protein n=1 Tax=Penicillium paradoxum TaxID=176176 RepID=UPI00254754F7|nr:uncharacterized protein N7457_000716 [Penicillium paradoxum]KAJ5794117.1 hypothetical protein N7457_000716 [Penicillium paradoxum]
MGETVFGELLLDLRREEWTTEADAAEAAMKLRAEAWDTQDVPFGSGMAWNRLAKKGCTTGAPTKTIISILGHMPTVPHCNAIHVHDDNIHLRILLPPFSGAKSSS